MYRIIKIGSKFVAGIYVKKPFLYFFTINKFEIIGQENSYDLAVDLCIEHKKRDWSLFAQTFEKLHPEFILPPSLITDTPYTIKDIQALTATIFSKN